MIQFNLLPDVKIKYIKARRQKRLVMMASFIAGASALAVVGLMISYVYVVQGSQIASLNKKISTSQKSIGQKNQQVDDINKVLTVQNQLISLDKLHSEKPAMSRIFEYLAKITPSNITISKLDVSNAEESRTIAMQGSTDTLESINKFVDTLKFTTYKIKEEDAEEKQIFTKVVLNSFGRNKAGASYALSFEFDPVIFSQESSVEYLNVPSKVTTRSELGRPIIQSATEEANNAPETTGGTQ